MNSLSFCLSGKLLISPSYLKESLAGQSILGFSFFPFISLNLSYYSLLACRVSVERPADSLIGVPLYVAISPCFLNIFSLSLIFDQFDYWVSCCVNHWVYPSCHSLCFSDLVEYFLSHVQEVFSYYFFKYFLRFFLSLSSFQYPYNANVDAFTVVPEVSQAVFIPFHSFLHIF